MTKPYTLHRGDCLAVMRTMADASVDSVVTDPPYELGFMGKSWDSTGIAYNVEMWRDALRVLKPGGHLLAFSGSRTYHRMACAIEDAGFEVRDRIRFEQSAETKYGALFDSLTADQRGAVMELLNDQVGLGSELAWLYGSGFPKSRDIGKAIDKEAGAAREVISEGKAVKRMIPGADQNDTGSWIKDNGREYVPTVTRAATADAATWSGWGTALKPSHEPICVARKPLAKGLTVAANVLAHGTGAINVDGCRVGSESTARATLKEMSSRGAQGDSFANQDHRYADRSSLYPTGSDAGRWPANVIHDGSDEVVALFPYSESGSRAAGVRTGMGFHGADGDGGPAIAGSAGSAGRFFYCAKASRTDRNEGLASSTAPAVTTDATMRDCETADWSTRNGNYHPTVKPTDLIAYLCRLITPPGGKVLDMFFGSGSTGKACMREGFEFVGIDKDEDENGQPLGYLEIATARIEFELARVIAANTPPPPPAQADMFAGESHAA